MEKILFDQITFFLNKKKFEIQKKKNYLMGFIYLYIIFDAIFLGILYKSFVVNRHIYDVCLSLYENRFYFFILICSIVTTILHFNKRFLSNYFNNESTMKYIHTLVSDYIYDFIMYFIHYDNFFASGMFFVSLLPLIFKIILESIKHKISFTNSTKLPTISQHVNVLMIQAIIILCAFASIISNTIQFHAMNNYFNFTIIMNQVQVLIISMEILVKHIVLLFDRDNYGNSQKSFYITQTTDFVSMFGINVTKLILAIGYLVSHRSYVYYFFLEITSIFQNIRKNVIKYNKWKQLIYALKYELDDPTQEDIDNDDTCIICRLQMDTTSAKKLPCGHCLHLDCLERWIAGHSTCPLCQYDLSDIITQVRNADIQNHPREEGFIDRFYAFLGQWLHEKQPDQRNRQVIDEAINRAVENIDDIIQQANARAAQLRENNVNENVIDNHNNARFVGENNNQVVHHENEVPKNQEIDFNDILIDDD